MSITRHHNEWLSLVPNSGPFLSLPVLGQAFPQGLDTHDAEHARRLRLAFNEWDENELSRRPDPTIHRAWIKFVLGETLAYDELLADGQAIPQTLKSDVAEYGETLRPDWIVSDPATKKPRLLVQAYSRSQSLTKPVAASRWKTSPDTRMMQLLHDTGIRLGVVTNGFDWMLVNAPKNETTGFASWRADLWQDEPITLRAFRSVLGADRLFSVPDDETLEALLDKSAADQQEVTDQLGYQVRKAVEVLIQALDKADQEHGRKLLRDLDEKVLYESALTVMMRLVFLFCAEERELLLLGDDLYDRNFAVSTLREQLEVAKSEHTEEILGLRFDAWPRLLTTFRAVYAGVRHDRLKLLAYGGSLFDPDRFAFLEGRRAGTSWKDTEATPLPVSNRTVLHLLDALQVLQTKVGKTVEARKLSFRALDIEQIGHVYEGLLDHTARRATEPVLGLAGTRDKEPEVALAELEKLLPLPPGEGRGEGGLTKAASPHPNPLPEGEGTTPLLKLLKDQTGRAESALKKGLTAELDDQLAGRFRTACQDPDLWQRVKPFAGLVRLDTAGYPVVILPGSVFVTAGTDRRSSGTHYTPKSLTEPIVQYTLEPLVFVGPAEGLPKEQWQLRPARELLELKICDMACGSGAFLVQACRYMAARLLEAWSAVQQANPSSVRITPEGEPSAGQPGELLIPDDPDERLTYALRIVAQRCLYGVDINPLAVEMAKLSLWLLTLAKDQPFEFLDHAIRCGDSLVGISSVDQLLKFSLSGDGLNMPILQEQIKRRLAATSQLRRQIETLPNATPHDVELKERMFANVEEQTARFRYAADLLIASSWQPMSEQQRVEQLKQTLLHVELRFKDLPVDQLNREARQKLNEVKCKRTFHWPLEFPEVFVDGGGFHAFVCNPPFMGGQKITGNLGDDYREYLVERLANAKRGSADLCCYFFLRANGLWRQRGLLGFLATNTIGQGDTREVGLKQLIATGCTIPRAIATQKWPGDATVEISIVWVAKGSLAGNACLGGIEVRCITAALNEQQRLVVEPQRLARNALLAFKGTEVNGMGFVLSPAEATELIEKNPRNRDVLFPFLNGADLNTQPDQSATRWIINFRDWPLDRAEHYSECIQIVRERVVPELQSLSSDGGGGSDRASKWWQFRRIVPDMYQAIAGRSHVLVIAQTSRTLSPVFVPALQVLPKTLVVFTFPGYEHFSLLASSIHVEWVIRYGSSLRTDMRYTPTDCFETFPFPVTLPGLSDIGERYHRRRQQTMLARQEGLTKVYNRFHCVEENAADIETLRSLHLEMDKAVAAAYGWTDLDLGHGFHETKQGVRFTISEAARREVLARLLKLNHERYAEEVKQGLHEKKPKATKGRKQANVEASPGLFHEEEAR